MITIVTPNTLELPFSKNQPRMSVFLAGTIDNGDSLDWQSKVIWYMKYLNQSVDPDADESIGDIIVYNPRRDDWKKDATEKDVEEQILWEQEHLDKADYIVMFLQDDSKSPISLLELGLYAETGKLFVFCTDKFYRYTNVRLTCEKYNINLINTNDCKMVAEKIRDIYDVELEIQKIKSDELYVMSDGSTSIHTWNGDEIKPCVKEV